jgi:hypothetical protein
MVFDEEVRFGGLGMARKFSGLETRCPVPDRLGLSADCYVLWRVQEVLLLVTLAILVATAIEPLVDRLRGGPFS